MCSSFRFTHYAIISAQLNGPCNGTTHDDRTRELAAFLQGSEAFRKAPGRHAMAVSHWGVRPVLLSELKSVVVPSQMSMLLRVGAQAKQRRGASAAAK